MNKEVTNKINDKGFTLIELLITLAIFGILLVTTTSIIVVNLKVARKIKARSYAREESAFMLNLLKKDIRNAEEVLCLDSSESPISCNDSYDQTKLLVVLNENSVTQNYVWYMDGNNIARKEEGGSVNNYFTPEDLEFRDLAFVITEGDQNAFVSIGFNVWTRGMYGDPEDESSWLFMRKEVIVSTRNYIFQ